MHTRSLVFLVLVAFVASGCRKTSAPAPAATTATPAPAEQQLNQPVGGTTPPPQTKHFKGSIGSTLDLQMKLVREGDKLTGSYFYQKIGTRINLRGTVDKDGNLTLEEFDPSGKQTGVFKGLWQVEAEDGMITLAGNWSKPPGEKGDDKKTAFSVHEEPINFTGDVEVVAKQFKENNKKLMYEIEGQYPQLTGNNPNFERFNQAARGFFMRSVADFKKDMQPEEGEGPQPEGSMASYRVIGYTIALAQDDLVSVLFEVGGYYQGAAHPNSHTEVLNYDLKNGKQLRLADLFKPGAKYLQTLSAYCIAELKKQTKKAGGPDLPDDQIESGAAPTAKNFESWTITRRGLKIDFDAYQVGPYAAGPQSVVVPYAALKDLIKPDGPVAQFAL